MGSPITPSNMNTWKYIEQRIEQISIGRMGRTLIIRIDDREVRIPPYPEIKPVKLIREETIKPDVPRDWIAQWKANGSNIRIYSINDVLIAVSRGGFLLDWKPYAYLIDSKLKERLLEATRGGRYVLFGELVGPKSLVHLCVEYWRKYLGGDIGYLLFDVFDIEHQLFLDIRHVQRIADEYGIMFSPTEWEVEPDLLAKRMEGFLHTCHGEAWEGFVFKDPKRGSYKDVEQRTLKWRMDETREYAIKIFRRTIRDPVSWRIYEALRKFIFEGYLDPPITINHAEEETYKIREQIQEALAAMDKGEIAKERADKIIKKNLYRLAEYILSKKIKSDRWYKKARGEAIKMFRKIHVYTY